MEKERKQLNILEKLSLIQNELKVTKDRKNTFGNYKYRSCEDIMEAAKPVCKKYNTVLKVGDTLEFVGDRYYIKATAVLFDLENMESALENTSFAREEETKKGMDASQITGTASSYARKYALNGLFNLDDNKDADTDEYSMVSKNVVKEETKKTTDDEIRKFGKVAIDLIATKYGRKLSALTEQEKLELLVELNA